MDSALTHDILAGIVILLSFRDALRLSTVSKQMRDRVLSINIMHRQRLLDEVTVDDRCVNIMSGCDLCTVSFPGEENIRAELRLRGNERLREYRLLEPFEVMRERFSKDTEHLEKVLRWLGEAVRMRKIHLRTILLAHVNESEVTPLSCLDVIRNISASELVSMVGHFSNDDNGKDMQLGTEENYDDGNDNTDSNLDGSDIDNNDYGDDDNNNNNNNNVNNKNNHYPDNNSAENKRNGVFLVPQNGLERAHPVPIDLKKMDHNRSVGSYCHAHQCSCTARELQFHSKYNNNSSNRDNENGRVSANTGRMIDLLRTIRYQQLCINDNLPVTNSTMTCFFDSDYPWYRLSHSLSKNEYADIIGPKSFSKIFYSYEESRAYHLEKMRRQKFGDTYDDHVHEFDDILDNFDMLFGNYTDRKKTKKPLIPFVPVKDVNGWDQDREDDVSRNWFLWRRERAGGDALPLDQRVILFVKRYLDISMYDPFHFDVWIIGNDFCKEKPDRDTYTLYVTPQEDDIDTLIPLLDSVTLGSMFTLF